MNIPRRLAATALAAATLACFGAGQPAAEPLAWADAVREARTHNPSLAASRASVESAKSGVTIATAVFMPRVSASGNLNRSGSRMLDPLSPETYSTGYSLGGNASLSLFEGGANIASYRKARAELARQEAEYRQASRDLRLNLRQAFNRLLYTQRNLELLKTIRDRLDRDARYQDIQFQSGREPRWTSLKARADVAGMDWQISQAKVNLAAGRMELAQLLGRDVVSSTALEVSGALDTSPPPDDIQTFYEVMEKQNPDLAAQKASVDSSEASLAQSRATRWPSVDANGNYSWSNGAEWPPTDSHWSAGVTASYTLFAGGAQEAAISAAKRAWEGTLANLADRRASLRSDLFQAWGSFRMKFDRMPVLRLSTEASSERFKTVQALYEAGRAGYLDFEQAESTLTQAEQQLLSGQLDAAQAESAWAGMLGTTIEDEERGIQ